MRVFMCRTTLAAASLACVPLCALGQVNSATVRGRVLVEGEPAAAGTAIVATNPQTGFSRRAATADNGSYALVGLTPGIYQIQVTGNGYEKTARALKVQIGQTVDLDLHVARAAALVDKIIVFADSLLETRTSEVATNVGSQRIESLPQDNRNFLNFAALAPGVRINDRETQKTFQAGALPASAVNVYIDGVSYKNQVIDGGIVGQDSSRGNPFPQNAVQEFRVITQNFKAEYAQAASSIITARTKSGTNEFHGDAFVLYQDQDLLARDDFARPGEPRARYERRQYGASFGGPLIEDRLHFFLAYEGNDQERAARVTLGNPAFASEFGAYEGSFTQPFHEDLLFAKLDYQPTYDQVFELTFSAREESDIKDFGGERSYESATDIRNDVRVVRLGHTYDAEGWVNEAMLMLTDYKWHPTPLNPDLVGREYVGVVRIGGGQTRQNIGQRVLAFEDDFTFTEFEWQGEHLLKAGLRISRVEYDVQKFQAGNPLFRFRPEVGGSTFPAEALYGAGNPDLSGGTAQYGLYVQDDWNVTARLTFNLGVRWDYDSDLLEEDHATPPEVRAAAAPFVPPGYFSDGDDRDSPTDLIQPRVGLSFDLFGDDRTVLFGGIGRYVDRVLYNEILDERFRLQWQVRRFLFSADGQPREGQPTILWNDAYLSRAGLDGLIAAGIAPQPEIFLIENGTRVPETVQASLGVRQRLRETWLASLALAHNRSRHGFSFIFANRYPDGVAGPLPDGECCAPVGGGFGNILISTDDKQAWYTAAYLTLERAYTAASPWGMTLAYTYADAQQTGGDLFSLDYPSVAQYPRHPTRDDERHRLVMTGITALPWDMQLSSTLTLGSGSGYTIVDQSAGTGPGQTVFRLYEGRPRRHSFILPDAWAYRSLDLRVEKSISLGGGGRLRVLGEVFNVFDYENVDPLSYNGTIAAPGQPPNPAFGQPTELIEPGRRVQAGMIFSF